MKAKHHIEIIANALSPVAPQVAMDNKGNTQEVFLVREQPLTIYLNRIEIVTVMTMGATPVELIVGFLLNQHLIQSIDDIDAIHVDWSVNAAAVSAHNTTAIQEKTQSRVVTSGCGQGTMFASVMDNLSENRLDNNHIPPLSSQQIYRLLEQLSGENAIYRKAGGVHSCAICSDSEVIRAIEDVGRHNAVDSLAGFMALNPSEKPPLILYTTGRLTSEMVIKTAQMGLPYVISRSGATSMGVEVAKTAGITLISRAKGTRFLVLNGQENVDL